MVTIYNDRGQEVGNADNGVYITFRDFKKGEIFLHPKYRNAIGVDVLILKRLLSLNVDTIRVRIINMEERAFFVETNIYYFLENSQKINFDKFTKGKNITKYSDQRIMPFKEWTRVILEQEKLLVGEISK